MATFVEGDKTSFVHSTLDMFAVWLEQNCVDLPTGRHFLQVLKNAVDCQTNLLPVCGNNIKNVQ